MSPQWYLSLAEALRSTSFQSAAPLSQQVHRKVKELLLRAGNTDMVERGAYRWYLSSLFSSFLGAQKLSADWGRRDDMICPRFDRLEGKKKGNGMEGS